MIVKDTKVMVYSKTAGSDIEKVFSRSDPKYPRSFPFIAWVSGTNRSDSGREAVYIIKYTKYCSGGDYYLRNDFVVMAGDFDFFKDEEFEI